MGEGLAGLVVRLLGELVSRLSDDTAVVPPPPAVFSISGGLGSVPTVTRVAKMRMAFDVINFLPVTIGKA
jgi:hypothetical protein